MKFVLMPELQPKPRRMRPELVFNDYKESVARHGAKIDTVKSRNPAWTSILWSRLTSALFEDTVSVCIQDNRRDLAPQDRTVNAPALYGHLAVIHQRLEVRRQTIEADPSATTWPHDEFGQWVASNPGAVVALPTGFSAVSLAMATYAINDLNEGKRTIR